MTRTTTLILLWGAAALAGSTGCAGMKVEVAILDREVTGTAPFLGAAAEEAGNRVLGNRQLGVYAKALDAVKADARAALDRVLNDPALARAVPVDPAFRAGLARDIAAEVDEAFAPVTASYDRGLAELRALRAVDARDAERRRSTAAAARQAFANGDQALEQFGSADGPLRTKLASFFQQLGTSLKQQLPNGTLPTAVAADLETEPTRIANKAGRRLGGMIGDAGILDDPAASLVVTAPERYWRGTFNKTFGDGTLGNTDVAVKMQGLGDFTLKGVRLDATKVTPAVFQGAILLTKLAAAYVGVPVGAASGGGTDGAPQAHLGDDLLEADTVRREARRRRALSKLAAVEVLDAITAERQAITQQEGNDATANAAIAEARKQAVDRVKKAFQDNRARLEIAPAQSQAAAQP